jgi:hypothetical protein
MASNGKATIKYEYVIMCHRIYIFKCAMALKKQFNTIATKQPKPDLRQAYCFYAPMVGLFYSNPT